MRYATWKIDWSEPKHGTGPESLASDMGWQIEAGPFIGGISSDGIIVGYLSDEVDVTIFDKWDLAEITQEQAILLVEQVDSSAFITDSGRIGFPENHFPGVN